MNARFVTTRTQSAFPTQFTIQDEEKARIMEKVYNSDVFKEFIRQWGDAMNKSDRRSI